jgi:hypothetical protein
MAQINKKSAAKASQSTKQVSSSTSSNPKTPVRAQEIGKSSGGGKGRPRKKSAKENEEASVSPLGELGATKGLADGAGESEQPGLAASSDTDVPTTVAEENRILRERLAKAECE